MATRVREAAGTAGQEESSRVLVVSACSKRKHGGGADEAGNREMLAARDRYAGRAHMRVRDAVDRWRRESADTRIEWSIVSAGLGLLDETATIPEYEATFAGLGAARARAHGLELALPEAFRARLARCDAAVFVLPLVYLNACGAPFDRPAVQLYFASPAFAGEGEGTVVVPCGVIEARRDVVTARDVASVRFAAFVDDAVALGFDSALAMRGSGDVSA